ncbi:MAG TPA: hypothetical protein VGO46_05050 [Gemmatimonadaceae bacterium]|jgi:hypothetical protein|nr:hypothetical protein [Gemmatimonadaceae bacterium]
MHRSYRIALSLAVTMLLAGALPASAVTTSRGRASDSATGCLQKGDKPDSFKLVGKDGKTWDVWSKKVSLAGHVGHTVTLTGDVTKGGDMSGMKDTSMSKMGDSSKMSGMSMSSGSMNVSSMTMVSATCS